MKTIIIFLLFTITCTLVADNLSGIDPAYYDYNPRLMAMGGAGIALSAYSPSALLSNPAALAAIAERYTFEFSNSSYLGLFSYNYLGASFLRKDSSKLSFALDFNGDEIFSEYELMVSWGVPASMFVDTEYLEKLDMGITLKLLGSSFGNNTSGSYIDINGLDHQVSGNAFGYAVDLGMQYRLNMHNRIGIFNRNLVNDIFWNSSNEIGTAQGSYSESRPVALIFGYAFQTTGTAICLDYNKSLYTDGNDILKSGLEVNILNEVLALRCGYSTRLFSLENSQFNIGSGIRFRYAAKDFRLDLAYRFFTPWQGHNNLLLALIMKL